MGFDWQGLLFGSQGDPNRNSYTDGDYIRTQAQQQIGAAGGRVAPQAVRTQVDPTMQAQFRQREVELADQLGRVLGGQQKGAGEMAVDRQTGQAMNQAMGTATMGRGNSAASAARSAARSTGAIGLGGAGMAAQAAAGDQAQAGQLLSGVLGQGRSADINIAGQNAQMDQALRIENIRSQLAQQGMNDAQIAAMLQQLGTMNQSEMASRGTDNGIIGGLIQGGAAIAASDERVKTDISDASDEMDDALRALAPRRYRYTDPDKHGAGSRVGIMAQDLEDSAAGSDLVIEIDGVKMIDKDKALSFALAAVARLAERVSQLEGSHPNTGG